MTRSQPLLAAVLWVALAHPCTAQTPDRGSFVTVLGNDTLALERFERTSDRIEGTRVLTFPRTSVINYTATVSKDGKVRRFQAAYRRGDDLDAAPRWSSITDFGSGQAVTLFTSGIETDTIRIATGPEALPMLLHSYALYEQVVRRARSVGKHKVSIHLIYPGQAQAGGTWVSPISDDSVAINYFHEDAALARVDREGRLLGFDGRPTVLKVVVTRGPDVDVMAIARRFADRDRAGQALGQLSPRDTVKAIAGGSNILIDYGRPSRRGRVVFGGLVPWNQVWRTGANAATQFTTSRDIRLGSTDLKAGGYTLWTIPGETTAWLVVNGQTGQWGTDYDASRDVARIPLTVRRAAQTVERFTIALVPTDGGEMELRLSWDMTEWAVPVRAKQ